MCTNEAINTAMSKINRMFREFNDKLDKIERLNQGLK